MSENPAEVEKELFLLPRGTVLRIEHLGLPLSSTYVTLVADTEVTEVKSTYRAMKPVFAIAERFLTRIGDGDSPLTRGIKARVSGQEPNKAWRGMAVILHRQLWDVWHCYQVPGEEEA